MEKTIDWFLLEKSMGGTKPFCLDILKVTSDEPGKMQLVGRLISFHPCMEYIHLAEDCRPLCVRYDGGNKFKVPVGEYVSLFSRDRLYFPDPNGEYYVEEGMAYLEIPSNRIANDAVPLNTKN